jgi:hypothetical protein
LSKQIQNIPINIPRHESESIELAQDFGKFGIAIDASSLSHPSLLNLDPLDFAQINQAGSANVQNRPIVADRNFPDRFWIHDLVSRAVATNEREWLELGRAHELAILIDRWIFGRRNNDADDRRKRNQDHAAGVALDAENVAFKAGFCSVGNVELFAVDSGDFERLERIGV